MTTKQIKEIRKQAKIELARREFWSYCNLKAPEFYKSDRKFLVELCQEFQDFYESDDKILVVNLPPRHGKSRTAGLFTEWILGKNVKEKVITASYNEKLSTTFSKSVRNNIEEVKADEDIVVYSEIFPNTKIKKGDGSANLWSLVGGHANYLATSPSGAATGFGCTYLIIDDLIKNDYEAYNEGILEDHWTWFTRTAISRREEGSKIIIIMTRWSTSDLAGKALKHFQQRGTKIRHILMKALNEDGKMLCDGILSLESFEENTAAMGSAITSANYQQEPIDLRGRLYNDFKTYDRIPLDKKGNWVFESIKNYTDTADQGGDYLCSITFGVYNGEGYVLDVIYTKEPMEVTEPKTAEMLIENGVNVAHIESNSGGRGFARAVQRIISTKKTQHRIVIKWHHQSANKKARILSNSTWVMNHIYFPSNWYDRWKDFHYALMTYQREGKNKHDDAPDALTGVAENIGKKGWTGWGGARMVQER